MTFSSGISAVLEPMVVLCVTALIAGLHGGLTGVSLYLYISYIFVLLASVWIVRLVLAKKDRTNWDVSDRRKRIKPLAILFVMFAANMAVISLWRNDSLSSVFYACLYWIVGFFLISLRTKISGHVSILTLCIGLIIRWFGASFVPLLGLVPLLAWSRLVLKRHTPVEVIGGFGYSVILLFFVW